MCECELSPLRTIPVRPRSAVKPMPKVDAYTLPAQSDTAIRAELDGFVLKDVAPNATIGVLSENGDAAVLEVAGIHMLS